MKSHTERQAALAQAITVRESKRDKAIAKLELKVGAERRSAEADAAKLRDLAQREQDRICSALAAEEVHLLQTPCYRALADYRPADLDVLATHYRACNARSLEFAGYDLQCTGRLVWSLAEARAVVRSGAKLGTADGLPVGGLVGYELSAGWQYPFEGQAVRWLPSQRQIGHVASQLHAALLTDRRHDAIELLKALEQSLDELLRSAGSPDFDIDARWHALRLSGSPRQIYEAMKAIYERESGPRATAALRASAAQALAYSLQQGLHNGRIGIRAARAQFTAEFPDQPAPQFVNPGLGVIEPLNPVVAPPKPSRFTSREIDQHGNLVHESTSVVDAAHPQNLRSERDGYPVTEWVGA